MTQVQKRQTEITSPVVYRVRGKEAPRETFYLVKSDSQANTFYEVRFDHSALVWRCNCDDKHRSCKHNRAVGEVLRLRRIRIAEAMGGDMPAIVAETQSRDDRRTDEYDRERLPLNGNRPFSLMR